MTQEDLAPIAHAFVDGVVNSDDISEPHASPSDSASDTPLSQPLPGQGPSNLCAVVAERLAESSEPADPPEEEELGATDAQSSRLTQNHVVISSTSDVQKPRRTRHRFSWRHTTVLERVFLSDPFPPQVVRTELAEKLGVTVRCVQIWFQNRRQKWKELHSLHGEMALPFKKLWQRREAAIKEAAAAAAAAQAPAPVQNGATVHGLPQSAAEGSENGADPKTSSALLADLKSGLRTISVPSAPILGTSSSQTPVPQHLASTAPSASAAILMNHPPNAHIQALAHGMRTDLQAVQSQQTQVEMHLNELRSIHSQHLAHQQQMQAMRMGSTVPSQPQLGFQPGYQPAAPSRVLMNSWPASVPMATQLWQQPGMPALPVPSFPPAGMRYVDPYAAAGNNFATTSAVMAHQPSFQGAAYPPNAVMAQMRPVVPASLLPNPTAALVGGTPMQLPNLMADSGINSVAADNSVQMQQPRIAERAAQIQQQRM